MAFLMIWPMDTLASVQGIVELRWNGIFNVTPGTDEAIVRSLPALAAMVILILALNVVGLFLYKRRPLQMRAVGVAAGLSLGLCAMMVYMSMSAGSAIEAEWHFCAKWLVPVLIAVMDALAYRGISDDEALIRSLERLR